jgi:hypothetical protein
MADRWWRYLRYWKSVYYLQRNQQWLSLLAMKQLKSIGVFCLVLWRTINLGRAVIGLTSKCEAGIMFN